MYGVLGRSLTTNGLESINALIEERCAKVDLAELESAIGLATALLDIEPRLRKVIGYRPPKLRDLKRELFDTAT